MNLDLEFKRTEKYLKYVLDNIFLKHNFNYYSSKKYTKNDYFESGDKILIDKEDCYCGTTPYKKFDNYFFSKGIERHIFSKKEFELNSQGSRILSKFGWYWYGVYNQKRYNHTNNIWNT